MEPLLPAPPPSAGRGLRGAAWRAVGLFVLLAVLYSFSAGLRASRGAAITGDEPFYLLTTQSLLEDGDLDLRQQYRRHSYRAFFDHPDGLWMQSVPTPDGRILSPHNPGLSVLLIPGFALGGLRGAQLQLQLLAALTFTLVYVWVARVTGDDRWSAWATLALAVSATPFVYATEIYPELPSALVLVAALLLLQWDERAGPVAAEAAATGPAVPAATIAPAGGRRELRRTLAIALLLAALLWLGIKYAPLAALVAAATFWRAGRPGRWTLVLAGIALAVPYGLFHLRVFGALTPYTVNVVYAGDSTPEVLRAHVTDLANRFYRLWGLFVDRRFGLVRWAPVLLLALPGVVALVRQRGAPRLVLGLMAAQHLMAVFVAITMMGWWFPGRTLMTVLPLYVLPLALVLQRGGRWTRSAFVLLAAVSVAVTAALVRSVSLGQVTVAVDPFAMPVGWFQAMGRFFPDYRSWTLTTTLLTALWLVVLAGLGAWGWRLGRRDQGPSPAGHLPRAGRVAAGCLPRTGRVPAGAGQPQVETGRSHWSGPRPF